MKEAIRNNKYRFNGKPKSKIYPSGFPGFEFINFVVSILKHTNMKNATIKILTILFTVLSFAAKSQTNVSGGIYTNTTWTLANSPYIIIDTVVVFPGVTLTIEPGIVVKFANNKRLEIRQASLIAVG